MYEHKDVDRLVFPYICITISFADPGGIILISPVRHSWLVTAVIIFEWEKQFKDVSTMIEYDLYIIIMLEIPRKEVDFEEKAKVFIWPLTGHCNTFWCTAAPCKIKPNSSSILANRYAANNFCVAGFPSSFSLSKTSNGNGSGVLTLKFHFYFSFYHELTWLAMFYVP